MKEITRSYKIYVDSDKSKKFESALELLKWFFVENRHSPTTYFKSGKIQCLEGKNRSLTEIVVMCKTYFPEITTVEVIQALQEINLDNSNFRKIVTGYCGNIRDITFRSYVFSNRWQSNLVNYAYSYIGRSGYSMIEVKQIADEYRQNKVKS